MHPKINGIKLKSIFGWGGCAAADWIMALNFHVIHGGFASGQLISTLLDSMENHQ